MKKAYVADIVLLGVTFTWGATFVLVKQAIQTMPPFTFLGTRFLIAALVLGVLILCSGNMRKQMRKEIWGPGIWLGFWLFGGYAFQTFGLQFTSASKAGFITGLSVVMVPLFSLWMLRHALKKNALIGVAAAAVGLAMLSLSGKLDINIGDVLVFFCAISYALQITLVGRYAPQFSALPLAFVQIFSCGVFNTIGALLFENYRTAFDRGVVLNQWVLSALVICSVIATAVAFVAQNQFQKFTTPTRTALIFSMEPVFAGLTGYLWAGDHLTTLQVSGCVLILCGMLIAEIGGEHKTKEA